MARYSLIEAPEQADNRLFRSETLHPRIAAISASSAGVRFRVIVICKGISLWNLTWKSPDGKSVALGDAVIIAALFNHPQNLRGAEIACVHRIDDAYMLNETVRGLSYVKPTFGSSR